MHDFDKRIIDDAIFFTDSLQKGHPCIFRSPRNHESLFFVTKGSLLYQKGTKQTVVAEGQVGYVARGSCDTSSPYFCDEVCYIAVNFRFDRTSKSPVPTLPFPTLCANGSSPHPYRKLFELALQESLTKQSGSFELINGLLLQIVGHLYHEQEAKRETSGKLKKIQRAVDYMKMHCGDASLEIASLAALAGTSEKHFRRIFKEQFGQTPYRFLQALRIDKACILLRNTANSISVIANACGFSDVYGFSHCFKAHTGLSPMQYREQN